MRVWERGGGLKLAYRSVPVVQIHPRIGARRHVARSRHRASHAVAMTHLLWYPMIQSSIDESNLSLLFEVLLGITIFLIFKLTQFRLFSIHFKKLVQGVGWSDSIALGAAGDR